MTQITIAEIETEKASKEIELGEDSGTLAELIVSESGTISDGEPRLEIKHLGFEIVVAMIVAAMLVALSTWLLA